MIQKALTVLQARDYLDKHIANGREDYTLMLDRRGLIYLRTEHHESITLVLPEEGHTHAVNKVFLHASF